MGSGWWISDLWQNGETVKLVSWIFWVIFSICLHELGHGIAAIWEGDDTPRITGHMTWNPMVHMGGASLIAFLLIGFAWGLMPVNPSKFRHQRFGDAVVAFAGPLVNLLLAVILLTASGLWLGLVASKPEASQWTLNVTEFLWTGGWINLILLALNLLPFPPLDGSRILGAFSYGYRRLLMNPNFQFAGLAFLMIVFWITPLGSKFLWAVGWSAAAWESIVRGLVS